MKTGVFDLADPYDAAAMYSCFLLCEACDAEPHVAQPEKYGLPHYHRLGQAAKTQGWLVALVDSEAVFFRVLCASCAAIKGFTIDLNRRLAPGNALLTIAALAGSPAADVTPGASLERTRDE